METNKKRHYEKPRLQEVKLVPEEAVLAGCKSRTSRGGSSCTSTRCVRTTRSNAS